MLSDLTLNAIYGKSFGKLKLRKWPGERKFLSTKKEKNKKESLHNVA